MQHDVYLYGADTNINDEYKQWDRVVLSTADANNE